MAKNEVVIKFLGDSKNFEHVLGKVERATSGLGGKMSAGFTAFKVASAAAFAGAGVAAIGFGKSIIEAATESQKVTRQTEAVLKSMGGAANVTADQIGRLSTSLSMKSGVDDEVIQSAQNVLLTFGKVRNEVGEGNNVFARATKAALDMSVALGTDMQGATIQIGKALNDPIKGITALGRAGVSFTEDQKEMIKSLVKSGDTLGAQKIILKELENQFGGSAAAQATAGDRLKVVWGNLQETLGAKLLPVIEKVATFLADNLPGALDKAGEIFNNVKAKIQELQPVVETVVTFVNDKFQQFKAFAQEVFPQVQEAIGHFVAVAQGFWNMFGDDIMRIVGGVFNEVKTIVETALGVIQGVVRVVLAVINGDWGKAWDALKGIVGTVWDGIKSTIGNAINAIKGVIGGAGDAIGRAAHGMFDGIKNAFKSAINFIIRGWNNLQFKIPGFKVGPVGYDGFTLGVPDIPLLARGGIVRASSGGTLAVIGEGGHDEAVVPLDGPHAPNFGGGVTVNVQTALPIATKRELADVIVSVLEEHMANGGLIGNRRGQYLRPS